MNIVDCLDKICSNENLIKANLKFCLMSSDKVPYTISDQKASPSNPKHFSDIEHILAKENVSDYAGVGVSIQASNICAIDVDHCFEKPFDATTCDERGKDIINMFKDLAYIEFSFSGTGLRLLFKAPTIDNYSDMYYIKNSKNSIEYYQPANKARYVSITGQSIYNNKIIEKEGVRDTLLKFLNKYMIRTKKAPKPIAMDVKDDITIEEALAKVKVAYLKNYNFQDLWFGVAPGSNKDESERDYFIISYLFSNVTTNKNIIKELFEMSPYYKSKDSKHIYKWKYSDFRYFNFIYNSIVDSYK